MRRIVTFGFLLLCGLSLLAADQANPKQGEHRVFMPDQIKWVNAPPSLEPGAKAVILEGDPSKEGIFTMRLWVPNGFKIQPHSHPAVEHVTVISGEFNIGMGDKFDNTKGQKMPQGTFGFLPPNMNHFAWATGDTVIQLHGVGPWQINYVDPKDDPRKRK